MTKSRQYQYESIPEVVNSSSIKLELDSHDDGDETEVDASIRRPFGKKVALVAMLATVLAMTLVVALSGGASQLQQAQGASVGGLTSPATNQQQRLKMPWVLAHAPRTVPKDQVKLEDSANANVTATDSSEEGDDEVESTSGRTASIVIFVGVVAAAIVGFKLCNR